MSAERVRVAFIVGTRRSGSTWLNAVLGSLSWAANLGEFSRPFDQPGHVLCRQCEADGLADCTVLHGLDAVPPERGYHFAAARFGDRLLIDASKRIEWAAEFVGRDDLDVRLIHLVRHPCGVVESEARRTPDSTHDEILAYWERRNAQIETFCANAGRPSILVSYEDLADDPHTHFPRLCEFLGGPWEPPALAYWNFPHHGLGGNGASSLYLRGRPKTNYVTGDDAYYMNLAAEPTRADERWRDRIPGDLRARVAASAYATALANRLGRDTWT